MDFKEQIAQLIFEQTQLPAQDARGFLEIPPNPELGDYAFPCFRLAKQMRMAPPKIAQLLADKLAGRFPGKVQAVGGYLNFFADRELFAGQVLAAVAEGGEAYGSSDVGGGRTVCIDYSSINIAKKFHIGHLSTTAIGNALYRIYNFQGYQCVGINHLGDWGTQFGKLIVAFRKWGDRAEVEKKGIDELQRLYVYYHEQVEAHPELDDEARAWFKKIEDDDPEAMDLFNWFKQLTMRDVARVYDLLGVTFDSYAGESFYNDKMGRVVDELEAKGLLVESEGARIVPLDEFNLPPCLIVKRDGATLYATRDIAAALYRKDTYDFAKCLYVVAYQQNLHFAQWFHVVEKMGYPWHKDLEHVAYGMVSMEDGALSTRKGRVIYLEDLLNKAIEKTRQIISVKSPDLDNPDEVARKVGVGAVVFNTLLNGRIKDIVFSWDRMLNFDGETGPYVEYTHVRCCSLLAKAGRAPDRAKMDLEALSGEEAQAVLRCLDRFPEVVASACQRNEPSMITRHIVLLAQAFNKFYYEQRILEGDLPAQDARLALVDAVRTVLKTGLYLLGIEAVEQM